MSLFLSAVGTYVLANLESFWICIRSMPVMRVSEHTKTEFL